MRRFVRLSAVPLVLRGEDGLPTEFRIFARGLNTSTNGDVLYDDAAAESVIAAYRGHGVRVQIDLNHNSVDGTERTRADAADARGWCDLADRNGELWAVRVEWTPDGAARLRAKKQRYISPVVIVEDATNQAVEIFNLALVATPALDGAPMLMRAGAPMDPKVIQEALDALIAGDAEKCMALLKDLITQAAGGESSSDEAPPAEGALTEGADPDAAALSRQLRTELRANNSAAVLATVRSLQSQVRDLQLARDAADLEERLSLVGSLVKCGAELPSTAWADADARKPAEHLASMSIASLRARVAAFAAKPKQSDPQPRVAQVSDADQAAADQIKDPAARQRFLDIRAHRANARGQA